LDKLWIAVGVIGSMVVLLRVVYSLCRQLLPVARAIDELNTAFGKVADWLILLAVLVSAGNAFFRYALAPIRAALASESWSFLHPALRLLVPMMEAYGRNANGFLEAQWYMFGGMVLLGAAYTLRVNEHVRVDLIYGIVSDKTRHWIDFLGGVVFLMPMCMILIYFTWPWFVESWKVGEGSTNAGGLLRWPVKLLLPVGFGLLAAQGFSEIVKRAAAIRGFHQHEYAYEKPLQ
jgi:TRAP-type mannitol/chloroaromatic compound transport system permease small subunit